ncbi:MAG: hypothetical protein H9W82_14110 [Lactobacillus sp.]|nr:hypothetical protein [Lactobacillus sp.]
MKRIFLGIGILLVIVFSVNYWLPRITLVRNHEATYLFPPSNKKFVSDVFYLIEKRGISELSTKKENRMIQQEMKKLDAKTYTSYQKMMPDLTNSLQKITGKHTQICFYENEEDKYAKFVSYPITSIDKNGIATIVLPSFSGTKDEGKTYVSTVNQFIETNKNTIKGVIIDLTSNNGGDSNVLLASVSQLLPNGNLLTFKGKHDSFTLNLSDTEIKTGNYSYQIKNYPKLNVPVAVMGSNVTSSSAEILLLAITTTVKESIFIGRDTGGYVSGREGYKLYGNVYLGLPTEAIQTNDKIVQKIDSPISPDIKIDAPLDTAKEWFSKFTLSTNK